MYAVARVIATSDRSHDTKWVVKTAGSGLSRSPKCNCWGMTPRARGLGGSCAYAACVRGKAWPTADVGYCYFERNGLGLQGRDALILCEALHALLCDLDVER